MEWSWDSLKGIRYRFKTWRSTPKRLGVSFSERAVTSFSARRDSGKFRSYYLQYFGGHPTGLQLIR